MADGRAALVDVEAWCPELILLDVMMPVRDGLSVCRELRRRCVRTPVLMITARTEVSDRVSGLDAGADDYLTKPFEFDELLARIRALLRRAPMVSPPTLQIADLTIDTASHRVVRGQQEVVLTSKEYALLEFLARNVGRVVTREQIAEHVWDEHFDAFSNLIEVYVNRLRRKMDRSEPHLIVTRRNEGYMLRDASEGA